MNIVFLCGCMEPGRDGVGDYTRRLALEVIRQKHSAQAVSLSDAFVNTPLEEIQSFYGIDLPVLRIPRELKKQTKLEIIRRKMEEFKPDCISLQYVIFSFHSKGLPFYLSKLMTDICVGKPFHIMFHELWITGNRLSDVRHWAYSYLQKQIIRKMLDTLKPKLIHTHLPLYFKWLQQINTNVRALPLFSNIPCSPTEKDGNEEIFRVGIFSQVPADGKSVAFLVKMAKTALAEKMDFEMLLIGEEKHMRTFEACIEDNAILRGKVRYSGFLETDALSVALQKCHLGLTPVPRHALGKSGSVASFLSHGIPVAAMVVGIGCQEEDFGFFSDELRAAVVIEPSFEAIEKAKNSANAVNSKISVKAIANTFLLDLHQSLKLG